jgi:hypothetical protein
MNFLLVILMLFTIPIILFDLYAVFVEKSYSRIWHYGKKYYTRLYIYFVKRHKIIMLDIDNEEIRDYNSIDAGIFVQKLNDIIRRETAGVVSRIDTYKTRKGRHIIIFLHNEISTREALLILDYAGVDEKYKQIFLIRGYFTLFQVRRGQANMRELLRYENDGGRMQVRTE